VKKKIWDEGDFLLGVGFGLAFLSELGFGGFN
jgi:hypothetical protein